MKYRKKSVVVDACQNDGDWAAMCRWFAELEGGDPSRFPPISRNIDGSLDIRTPEGVMRADIGDWVIRGVAGEYYPCKPDIFAATYEPAQ